MGVIIVTTVFAYDSIMKQHPWRWKALAIALVGLLLLIFVFFAHPLDCIAAYCGHFYLQIIKFKTLKGISFSPSDTIILICRFCKNDKIV